jgi:HupH hydrogenase expression protein, C-terminal conserved region
MSPEPSPDHAGLNDALTGNAEALLREILSMLVALGATGEDGSIDLASLPLSGADKQWLKDSLGEGAVRIDINASGPTTVVETATPGVWWVTHHNEQDAQVGEFIEVTLIPDIVPTHPDDVSSGVKRLEDRLTA